MYVGWFQITYLLKQLNNQFLILRSYKVTVFLHSCIIWANFLACPLDTLSIVRWCLWGCIQYVTLWFWCCLRSFMKLNLYGSRRTVPWHFSYYPVSPDLGRFTLLVIVPEEIWELLFGVRVTYMMVCWEIV